MLSYFNSVTIHNRWGCSHSYFNRNKHTWCRKNCHDSYNLWIQLPITINWRNFSVPSQTKPYSCTRLQFDILNCPILWTHYFTVNYLRRNLIPVQDYSLIFWNVQSYGHTISQLPITSSKVLPYEVSIT